MRSWEVSRESRDGVGGLADRKGDRKGDRKRDRKRDRIGKPEEGSEGV